MLIITYLFEFVWYSGNNSLWYTCYMAHSILIFAYESDIFIVLCNFMTWIMHSVSSLFCFCLMYFQFSLHILPPWCLTSAVFLLFTATFFFFQISEQKQLPDDFLLFLPSLNPVVPGINLFLIVFLLHLISLLLIKLLLLFIYSYSEIHSLFLYVYVNAISIFSASFKHITCNIIV